ncbi:MAG: hypothetical protein H6704_03095 [Myxococcales bacterium]|nr:hypothetical protein [Myxococcales bacterium]
MRALAPLLLSLFVACDTPAPPAPRPAPATPDAALLAPSGPLAALDRAPGPPVLLALDDPLTPLLAWLKEPATVAALEAPALRDWLAATGLEPGLLDPAVLSLGLVAQRDVVPDRVVVRGDGAARPAFAQALAALRGGAVEAPRMPRLTAHLRFRAVEAASAAETAVRAAFGESARFEGRLRDVLGERLDAVPHAETRAALAALPVTLHVARDGAWVAVALGAPLPREGDDALGFAARWAPGGPAARVTTEADGVRVAVRGLAPAPAALRRALPADAVFAWAWSDASPRGAVEVIATLLGPGGGPAAALAAALPADARGVAIVVRHPTSFAALEATVVRKGERAEVRLPGLPVPQVALVWPGARCPRRATRWARGWARRRGRGRARRLGRGGSRAGAPHLRAGSAGGPRAARPGGGPLGAGRPHAAPPGRPRRRGGPVDAPGADSPPAGGRGRRAAVRRCGAGRRAAGAVGLGPGADGPADRRAGR